MKSIKVLGVFVLLFISVVTYKTLIDTEVKSELSLNWSKKKASIGMLVDENGRSIVMPQLIIFNKNGKLISQIKQNKNLVQFDAQEIVNKEIPLGNDFTYINRLLPDKFSENKVNVFLIYPDPETLPMNTDIPPNELFTKLQNDIYKRFGSNETELKLIMVNQG